MAENLKLAKALRQAEMRPTPRSGMTGMLADALMGARNFADRARVPESVPLIGGQNLGSMFLGQAPEEINEMSYGNWPIQINPYAGRTASFVPEMKRGRGQGLADALSLLSLPGGKTAASMMMGAVPGVDAAMFIGPKAKTWDAAAAARAVEMEKAGVDPREIWAATGTIRGKDGKLRQEIDDSGARFLDEKLPAAKGRLQIANDYLHQQGVPPQHDVGSLDRLVSPMLKQEALAYADMVVAKGAPSAPLGTILQHGKAFMSYPNMGAIPLSREIGGHQGLRGSFDPATGRMTISDSTMINDRADAAKSTVLHELQHAIQQREGFARGGSPKSAADHVFQELLKTSERIKKIEANPLLFEGGKAIDKAFDAVINGRMTDREFYKIVEQHPIVAKYAKLQSFRRDAPKDGDEAYRRLAGEAEARATQARMNMTPAQRRAKFPYESYDVPLNQLIVR